MKNTTIRSRKEDLAALKDYNYIMMDDDFRRLSGIKRHGCTNTWKHSVRVAMAARKLADLWHEDPDAAVRAGLLHDYCIFDHNLRGKEMKAAREKANAELYCFYHPKKAAENAKRFHLSKRELDAISSHMFPLGPLPKTKLGWIIRIADIGASLDETDFGLKYMQKKKSSRV